MRGVQVSDSVVHTHVKRSHLNNRVVHISLATIEGFRASHIIVLVLLSQVEIFVKCGDYEIENWNNICGVVFELSVETVVKLEHVIAIYIQDILLGLVDFSQAFDVQGLTAVILLRLYLHEGGKEVPQLLLHLT